MDEPLIKKGNVWCPSCRQQVTLLRINAAAEMAGVSRRTIYRYIDSGSVFAWRIAGHTLRICGRCLIKSPDLLD